MFFCPPGNTCTYPGIYIGTGKFLEYVRLVVFTAFQESGKLTLCKHRGPAILLECHTCHLLYLGLDFPLLSQYLTIAPTYSPFYTLNPPGNVPVSPSHTPHGSIFDTVQTGKDQSGRGLCRTFPEKLPGIIGAQISVGIPLFPWYSIITDPFLTFGGIQTRGLIVQSQTDGIEYRALPCPGLAADQKYRFIHQRFGSKIYQSMLNGCYIFYFQ